MTNYELTTKKINKLNSKFVIRNCLFVIVFTFIVLAGLFGSATKANAQTDPDPVGTCTIYTTTGGIHGGTTTTTEPLTNTACTEKENPPSVITDWAPPAVSATTEPKTPPNNLLANIKSCPKSFDGCVEKIFYFIFISIPSFLLILVAKFFNAMVVISLSSRLFANSTFVSEGWAVVRDLSNLFFILVLLYIAIKIILDLGAAEAQKMITRVIIVALLINFSMFFTKVIIDSSNILALVFYNKISLEDKYGNTMDYKPITNEPQEKNIAGGMAAAFNPSQLLDDTFFENAKKETAAMPITALGLGTSFVASPLLGPPIYIGYKLYGYWFPSKDVPVELMLAIIVVSGIILFLATYAFFVAGFAFLVRLIELWILTIFSPFAFISFAVPFLEKVPYVGWGEWSKRLLTVSFMAPIFMFFMYLIFMLVHADMFGTKIINETRAGTIEIMVMVFMSALVIAILLLQATKFAKKGASKLGEMAMKVVTVAGTAA